MKKIIVGLTVLLTFGMLAVTYAATEKIIDVSAAVPDSTAEITVVIRQLTAAGQDPFSGNEVQRMDFGILTHLLADQSEAGVWYSPTYFAVIIFSNSFGKQYEIRSSSNGFASGGNTLPDNSLVLTPGYAAADEFSAGVAQGDQPAGSELGTAGPAKATNALIYRSELAGSNRIIRAFYSLPSLGAGGAVPFANFEPVPLSQTVGTYTGTVTVTIAAI